MIAELSAAMAALKETAGLIKVINEAKTDAEIKNATIELQSKLLTLQTECFALGDVVRQRDEESAVLKMKIAEYESFDKQTENFALVKFRTGALVYMEKKRIGAEEAIIYFCPQCFNQRVVSMLQPSSQIFYDGAQDQHFSQLHCQRCNAIYGKDPIQFRDAGYITDNDWE